MLRVIACELSRIISHLVWLGTTCIDIGAFTPFLWAFQQRERIYKLLETWIGARLTTTLTRVGGMGADIPDGWIDGLRRLRPHVPEDARRNRPHADAQRHLGRPHGRTRRDDARRGDQLRTVGPDAARVGRRLRRAQGFPVPRLRDVRLRRPGRHERRRLRSLPRAHGGAAPVARASSSRRSSGLPRRTGERGRSPRHPAAEEQGDERHGVDDPSLQAGDGRPASADRRGVRRRSRAPRARRATTWCPTARRSRCAGASVRRRS